MFNKEENNNRNNISNITVCTTDSNTVINVPKPYRSSLIVLTLNKPLYSLNNCFFLSPEILLDHLWMQNYLMLSHRS